MSVATMTGKNTLFVTFVGRATRLTCLKQSLDHTIETVIKSYAFQGYCKCILGVITAYG